MKMNPCMNWCEDGGSVECGGDAGEEGIHNIRHDEIISVVAWGQSKAGKEMGSVRDAAGRT